MEPETQEISAVRAKMQCQSIETTEFNPQYRQIKVNLGAVCGREGENKDFTDATPSGFCWMVIKETYPASRFFKPGKKYYVTFTEAPE